MAKNVVVAGRAHAFKYLNKLKQDEKPRAGSAFFLPTLPESLCSTTGVGHQIAAFPA